MRLCGGSSTLIRPLLLSSRSTLGGTRTTTKAPITTHWKDKVLPIGPPVRYCSARPPDKPAVVRVTSPGVSHTSLFFQPVHCYFFFRDEVIMRVGVGEDGGEGGEEGDPWELTAPSFTFRRPRAHRLRQTGSDGFGRIGGFLAF